MSASSGASRCTRIGRVRSIQRARGRRSSSCASPTPWRAPASGGLVDGLRSVSGQRSNLDGPEGDRKLLVLKPQVSFRKAAIVHVERRLAVQLDDEMIAVG